MAQRKTKTRKAVPRKTTGKKSLAARNSRRTAEALARLEPDLPPTLRDFSKRVRRGLTELEREIERVQQRYRRQRARLLREVSHQLGRFEAEGERRWKKLNTQARRDALRLLKRLEKAIEPPQRKKRPRKKTATRKVRVTKPPAEQPSEGRIASA